MSCDAVGALSALAVSSGLHAGLGCANDSKALKTTLEGWQPPSFRTLGVQASKNVLAPFLELRGVAAQCKEFKARVTSTERMYSSDRILLGEAWLANARLEDDTTKRPIIDRLSQYLVHVAGLCSPQLRGTVRRCDVHGIETPARLRFHHFGHTKVR